MIVVRITSGLGNQMYQYNFYRYLKERYPNTRVLCDLSWFKVNNDHHGYELERLFKHDESDFCIDKASALDVRKASGQYPPLLSGKLGKLVWFFEGPVNRILREKFLSQRDIEYVDQLNGDISNTDSIDENGVRINLFYEYVNHLDESKNHYFIGFFIEERYVEGRIRSLKKELVFPKLTDEENVKLSQDIQSCEAVSIHVRRGDYLSSTYSSQFKCLGREYYEKAVDLIKEKIPKPRFYIFSDDAEYIKEAFEWLDNKVIVDINHGDDSYKDMQLMSLCKANIIANSTFSQWGAILNKNDDAIVIYPKDYLFDEDSEIKSYKGWIRI